MEEVKKPQEDTIRELAQTIRQCCDNAPEKFCEEMECAVCTAYHLVMNEWKKEKVGEWRTVCIEELATEDELEEMSEEERATFGELFDNTIYCSNCEVMFEDATTFWGYCPNCGARMINRVQFEFPLAHDAL